MAGVVIFLVAKAFGVPAWAGAIALAVLVLKDLALYPAMAVVFEPASDNCLVGVTGRAVETLAPTGYILVAGERWQASVGDGRPVPPGTAVRVVGARGMTLLVEPS
jgi:membrane protein implicated in regulation of membrane protease activity